MWWRITGLLSAFLCAAVVVGCNLVFGPQINCGPLGPLKCNQHVEEIQTVLGPAYPDRRVASIDFVNDEGDATVRLDDGSEIGWGGSDGPPPRLAP